MAGQSGSQSLSLGSRDALQDPGRGGTCSVALVQATFEYDRPVGAAGTVSALRIEGVSGGAREVEVALRSWALPGPTSQRAATAADGKGTFTVDFDLGATPLPLGSQVTVIAVVTDPAACNASVEMAVVLGAPTPNALLSVPARDAGFAPSRDRFVAGDPDRFVFSRFFLPLACSYGEFLSVDKRRLLRMAVRVGGPVGLSEKWVSELQKATTEAVGAVAKAADGGGNALRERELYKALATAEGKIRDEKPLYVAVRNGAALKQGKRGQAVASGINPAGKLDTMRLALAGGVVAVSALPATGTGPQGNESIEAMRTKNVVGVMSRFAGGPLGITEGVTRYLNLGWLGVLYFNRVRMRPAGTVAGERIYSVSLAPGEEVTYTQRSETKRSRFFEEVVDSAAEQELEFSSTWSTDLSQATTETDSYTSTKDLGLSLGVKGENVTIGGSASASVSDMNSATRSEQTSRAQSMTSRTATKLRSEHKTTFRVGTDITEEFGSRRVLRNSNPLRQVTYHVHKLYEKTRIFMERYDARLCLGVFVNDPGRELRQEVFDEFTKLDPVGYASAYPGDAAGKKDESRSMPNTYHEDAGLTEYARATFEVDIPPGMVLSGYEFKVTKWTVMIPKVKLKNGTPVLTYDSENRAVEEYYGRGGQVTWVEQPPKGKGGRLTATVSVLLPEEDGLGWYTGGVEGTMTWLWAPPEAVLDDITEEKANIRASFSQDRVTAVLDEVESGARDAIFRRLIEEIILPGYAASGINPPLDVIGNVRRYFDWEDMYVEYIPWWMTAAGQQNRDDLRRRLLTLPGDTRTDWVLRDFLVASCAKVYLPLRPGCEQDALNLLTGRATPSQALGECLREFNSYRRDNFAAIERPLPSAEEVVAPSDPSATPASAAAWQSPWEQLRRNFIVLDEWAEYTPTDGIHAEPVVGSCAGADEARLQALASDLRSAAAIQEETEARATLDRELAARTDIKPTVVVGDPTGRRP